MSEKKETQVFIMSDAEWLGVEAAERGDEESLNPYDEKDQQHAEWKQGFDSL